MTEHPSVELFTQPHCAVCRRVEQFLRQRGVAFTVRDIVADPDALEELTSRRYMTTPVTRIGDAWVAGFNRRRLEWLCRDFAP